MEEEHWTVGVDCYVLFEDGKRDGSYGGGVGANSGIGNHGVNVCDFMSIFKGFDSDGRCIFLDGVDFHEDERAVCSFGELGKGLRVRVCGSADGCDYCVIWEGEVVGN